jgi:hypothetical protein
VLIGAEVAGGPVGTVVGEDVGVAVGDEDGVELPPPHPAASARQMNTKAVPTIDVRMPKVSLAILGRN